MSNAVELEVEGGIAVVTLNRPQARNAVDRPMAERLAAIFDDLDARTDVSVAILTGAEGTFCAGMDLKAFLRGERASLPGRGFAGLTARPPSVPLIAAVEGYAVGGGCEVVLACDMVVAASDAWFGVPEVKRGLMAVGGALLRLPTRIPHQIAMELLLTGELLEASRAARLGLVNHLAHPGEALKRARELAEKIAANGPLAVRRSKQIVTAAPEWPAAEAYERQMDVAQAVFDSEDAKEGARAFTEKRRPVWQGR